MAEQQKKIHPVDVDGAASPPVPRRGLLVSDKGGGAVVAPAARHRRMLPLSHSMPPNPRGRCCCRCITCTCLLLLALIIILAATIGILYLVFEPKAPEYSVDRLRISAFTVNTSTLDVKAAFDVTVIAANPNKRIGILYGGDSRLSVWYSGTNLCSGSFPAFYQGHRNTSVLTVALSGEGQIGSDLLAALQSAQRTGSVPLLFRGDVPVRPIVGPLKLPEVSFLVNCQLVVNSLTVNNQISIRSSSCIFKFKL